MNMKEHILTAMREQFYHWELLLAETNEAQLVAPQLPSQWSIKDIIIHLWAWQQRSIARVEAALSGREPQFPQWLPGVEPENVEDTEPINQWIYSAYHAQSWSSTHQNWREGYLRFLELGETFLEREMLDTERYTWLQGYSIALVYLASYDHHQEHLEQVVNWLKEDE